MKVLYPRHAFASPHEITQRGVRARYQIPPFDEAVIEMLDDLSKRLFKQARSDPALAPLAFFLRKTSSFQIADSVQSRLPARAVPVSQGLVFHVPPTNVDTLFLYTLSIALLTGNSNIVRVSENSGPGTFRVLEILFDTLDRHTDVAQLVSVVQFGREIDTLKLFSEVCDVRMIWGGDSSIGSVREAKLAPASKELTFPDRVSFAAISASTWLSSSDEKKDQIANAFFNDTFWFDQMACSSPQLLVIVSDSSEIYHEVVTDFTSRISAIADRKYELPEGQAINKMAAAVNAVAFGATQIDWTSNRSVFVDGMDLQFASAVRPGGGFVSTQEVRTLYEVLPQIRRTTQTMSTFGFSLEDLGNFARKLNGRGIDRIVSFGDALNFSSIWDGKDLAMELVRLIDISITD